MSPVPRVHGQQPRLASPFKGRVRRRTTERPGQPQERPPSPGIDEERWPHARSVPRNAVAFKRGQRARFGLGARRGS
jgi:hypothetical protein